MEARVAELAAVRAPSETVVPVRAVPELLVMETASGIDPLIVIVPLVCASRAEPTKAFSARIRLRFIRLVVYLFVLWWIELHVTVRPVTVHWRLSVLPVR